jgi:hypothetical protein
MHAISHVQIKRSKKLQNSVNNMHYTINPEEIKTEIENLGHVITNIWNIQQYRTKLPLSMFFVELKPAPNNKDKFNIEYIQQYKIKFEPPKHKRDIVQCTNCQRYGHTKNYCRLKPRCVKCAGDHLTNQCQRKKDRVMSDVFSVVEIILWIKRGCTVYKDLKKKTYPPLRLKQYNPPAQTKQTFASCHL